MLYILYVYVHIHLKYLFTCFGLVPPKRGGWALIPHCVHVSMSLKSSCGPPWRFFTKKKGWVFKFDNLNISVIRITSYYAFFMLVSMSKAKESKGKEYKKCL